MHVYKFLFWLKSYKQLLETIDKTFLIGDFEWR